MPDSRPRVLIVDDQPVNLSLLATALTPCFAVQLATNGADALALARGASAPEVILLDVMMPGMDGFAVCAALKADPLTADIPVIFITASTDAESESSALARGAADFIHKPLDASVVSRRVGLQVQLRQREQSLLDSNQRLEIALEAAALGLWDFVIATKTLTWSERHARLLGLLPSVRTATPSAVRHAIHPQDRRACLAALRRSLRAGVAFDQVYRVHWPDGSLHWLHSLGQLSRDRRGLPRRLIGTTRDVSALKAHEHELEHLAHYDALTGLPNRLLLSDRLCHALTRARRHNQGLAVVYVDLDGFKAINDAHGHALGDQLLKAVARRMQQALREVDTLARLGGDEFAAVLVDLNEAADHLKLSARLLAAASAPVRLGEVQMQVTASLGIALYSQTPAVDGDQLLRQADQAMYRAKQAGKNRYHLFCRD